MLLYSETVAEDAETITDKEYFTVFLKLEESRSGKLKVAVCEETSSLCLRGERRSREGASFYNGGNWYSQIIEMREVSDCGESQSRRLLYSLLKHPLPPPSRWAWSYRTACPRPPY